MRVVILFKIYHSCSFAGYQVLLNRSSFPDKALRSKKLTKKYIAKPQNKHDVLLLGYKLGNPEVFTFHISFLKGKHLLWVTSTSIFICCLKHCFSCRFTDSPTRYWKAKLTENNTDCKSLKIYIPQIFTYSKLHQRLVLLLGGGTCNIHFELQHLEERKKLRNLHLSWSVC